MISKQQLQTCWNYWTCRPWATSWNYQAISPRASKHQLHCRTHSAKSKARLREDENIPEKQWTQIGAPLIGGPLLLHTSSSIQIPTARSACTTERGFGNETPHQISSIWTQTWLKLDHFAMHFICLNTTLFSPGILRMMLFTKTSF
jgi:hypothetical protein